MQQLPKWALNWLNIENKERLKWIIASWNKEEFRRAVFELLNNEWDVNELVEEMCNLEGTFEWIYSDLLIQFVADKAMNSHIYSKYLIELIEDNTISEELWKHYVSKIVEKIISTNYFFNRDVENFILFIEKGFIERKKYQEKIDVFFDIFLKKVEEFVDSDSVHTLNLIIKNELIDKESRKERIERVLDNFFLNVDEFNRSDNIWNDRINGELFTLLYQKWYINKEKYRKCILRVMNKIKKEAKNRESCFKFLLWPIKDELFAEESEKGNIFTSYLLSQRKRNYDKYLANVWLDHYYDNNFLFESFLDSWLLDKDKYKVKIKKVVKKLLEKARDPKYPELKNFSLLVKKWYIDKENHKEDIDELINKVCVEQLAFCWEPLISNNLLDKVNHKRHLDEFVNIMKRDPVNDDNIEMLTLLLEKGYITYNNNKIFFNKLFKLLKEKIEENFSFDSEIYWSINSSGCIKLYNLLKSKYIKSERGDSCKFRKNKELINSISSEGFDKKIKVFNVLKRYFFDTDLLKELKDFIDKWYWIDRFLLEEHIEEILSHPKWITWWFFLRLLENWNDLRKYPIDRDNFLNFMEDDEVLFTFEKDHWFKSKWIIPWTKRWFLDNSERLDYLKPEKLKTFRKFGTIIWLWIIEWSQNSETLWTFYEHIFHNISLEKSRSSILQLWEVFNLILKQWSYHILDNLIDWEVQLWQKFKELIEKYDISDKWRTILTLMIAREINLSFAIFKDENWKKQVDSMSVKQMLLSVHNKLEKYKKVIKTFDKVPIKTSIWVEIEITESIAYWYKEITWGDYKNDIMILSEYSWIARWNDAVHEIATKPTDNPYLLLLELKLLEDLDFLDLNFKKEDYIKWARWLHITVWWEEGIELDDYTNFIQNILIASNLWWLNVWEEVNQVNYFSNIREKGSYEVENLFWKSNTCVEYRSLSIDKAEPFERLILAIFSLNMAYKVFYDVFNWNTNHTFINITKWADKKALLSFELFREYIIKKTPSLGKIKDEEEYKEANIFVLMAYSFAKMVTNITNIVDNHNQNFENNESIVWSKELRLEKLITLFTSTSPVIWIMKEVWIDIDYFKKLIEENIDSEKSLIEYLKKDNKNVNFLSDRQKGILFWTYNLKIKPELENLKKENIKLYENISEYLNGDLEDIIRKITNKKRFNSVTNWNMNYLNNLRIQGLFRKITPDLVNTFTKIQNLFIKKDSSNALSAFNTTLEPDGEKISNSELTETTIFDKIDNNLKERKGYNIIQWASKKMVTQAIQREVLNFIYKIIEELKK